MAVSPDGTLAAFGTSSAIYIANLAQHASAQLGLWLAAPHLVGTVSDSSGNSLWLANVLQSAPGTNQVYLYNTLS